MTKSKQFSNALGDSCIYVISCTRQLVAQELVDQGSTFYMRIDFVEGLLRESVS